MNVADPHLAMILSLPAIWQALFLGECSRLLAL
jgi:hypothetical protein